MIIVPFVAFFAIIFVLLFCYMAWFRIVAASKGTLKLDIPADAVLAGQKIRGTMKNLVRGSRNTYYRVCLTQAEDCLD